MCNIKFEYKVVKITYYSIGLEDYIEKELNILGENGWELISQDKNIYLLKRIKKSDYEIQNESKSLD